MFWSQSLEVFKAAKVRLDHCLVFCYASLAVVVICILLDHLATLAAALGIGPAVVLEAFCWLIVMVVDREFGPEWLAQGLDLSKVFQDLLAKVCVGWCFLVGC